MTKDELITQSIELIKTADAAYLTTITDDYPRTRAMLNLRSSKMYPSLIEYLKNLKFETYFTTNTSSIKIKNLIANPKVSTYYCKPDKWQGLMIAGDIEIIKDKSIKKDLWVEGWEMYYPKGFEDPDYSIIYLKPQIINIYYKLNFLTIDLRNKQ